MIMMDLIKINNSKNKDPIWNKWKSHNIPANNHIAKEAIRKVKAHILNLHNIQIESYKLEDGNGPILLLKELVRVLEEVIQQLYQALLLLFLEDIILPEKLKVMLISMIHIYSTLMQINLLSQKFLVHLLLRDMLIQLC